MIRIAQLSDAKPLSVLAERTFRDTYSAMNSAGDMSLHCRNKFSEAIQASEILDPNRITMLSEEDGELNGFAQLCWNKTPSCVAPENPGEINRFYVAREWHGKGVASALMTFFIEQSKLKLFDSLWLSVWEPNPKAIAFYKKSGFIEVGNTTFLLGNDLQQDIVMLRQIN